MSATTTSETSPPATVEAETHTQSRPDLVRDVVFWGRKYLSVLVLLAATATWVALQVYQFNFITVASWVSMFLVALMFIWGNIHRLLKREAPDVSGILEMSERSAVEMAHAIRECVEQVIRRMFRVGAEREWSVFAGTAASLGLLSLIASRFDLVTLLYLGTVLGMILPVVYVKYEHKIKDYGKRLILQSQKYYGMIEDKLKTMHSKVAAGNKKDKKIE